MNKYLLTIVLVLLASSASVAAQDVDLTKIARDFASAFQTLDEAKMDMMLTEDFRYYTNVACSYKDCDQGAGKTDYIKGVIDERREHDFKVVSVLMRPIDPLINTLDGSSGDHAAFACALITKAHRKLYQFQSVIDYYVRKDQDGNWKISKIENRIVH